ncbi:right-handed parallel beta-helix repeat-containing protein [Spongiimicrobium sp. 3-5]|uniref:right-handed parallel beta-helix repeat-containing protein n=1 Tax=Spongiimicrobium sp. 3-5 TaxID=3332596 RepID=UPI00397F63A5
MRHTVILFITFILMVFGNAFAQEIYVDSQHGSDGYTGDLEKPLRSIEKALSIANSFTGNGEITIKLNPGVYTLEGRADINPVRIMTDSTRYIIEAVYMPDAHDWSQEKMPKIQSTSHNNSDTMFEHSVGFLVSSSYVTLKGLTFLGNANPAVSYYYPIAKEDSKLGDLEVSQCYFIGNKEAAAIQAGVWAHGPNNTVSHCIFYECRNGVLFFDNVSGFTIENSIVANAYESAFWFGPADIPFTFTNNIITNNNNFLVGRSADLEYSSPFTNSIISNNSGYVGYWSREEKRIVPIAKPNIKEQSVTKTGEIPLLENSSVKLTKRHLHAAEGSTEKSINAGIFRN